MKLSDNTKVIIRAAYKSGLIDFETYNTICKKYKM